MCHSAIGKLIHADWRPKAVCVSACGNFGIASSSSGAIYMYSMQSGMKRKTFALGSIPPAVLERVGAKRKDRCVTGLASDSLNRVVVASTLDGTINVCRPAFHVVT